MNARSGKGPLEMFPLVRPGQITMVRGGRQMLPVKWPHEFKVEAIDGIESGELMGES